MLYREIIAVCSQIHTKHINTVCGKNVQLLNVKSSGTCTNHQANTSIFYVARSQVFPSVPYKFQCLMLKDILHVSRPLSSRR